MNYVKRIETPDKLYQVDVSNVAVNQNLFIQHHSDENVIKI